MIRLANQNRNAVEAHQPVRDLDQIRAFLTGPGPIAIVDLPWVPLFLAICFLIHPWLGVPRSPARSSSGLDDPDGTAQPRAGARHAQSAGARSAAIELTRRNSETVVAMGMTATLAQRWQQVNDRYLAASTQRLRRHRLVRQRVPGDADAAAVGDAWDSAPISSSSRSSPPAP